MTNPVDKRNLIYSINIQTCDLSNYRDRGSLESAISQIENLGNLPLSHSDVLHLRDLSSQLLNLGENDYSNKIKKIFETKITHLGKDVLGHLFNFLSARELVNLRTTCKAFKEFIDNDASAKKMVSLFHLCNSFVQLELSAQLNNDSFGALCRHDLDIEYILEKKKTFEYITHLGLHKISKKNLQSVLESLQQSPKIPQCLIVSNSEVDQNLWFLFKEKLPSFLQKGLKKICWHKTTCLTKEFFDKEISQLFPQGSSVESPVVFTDEPINAFVMLQIDGHYETLSNFLRLDQTERKKAFEQLPFQIKEKIYLSIGRLTTALPADYVRENINNSSVAGALLLHHQEFYNREILT